MKVLLLATLFSFTSLTYADSKNCIIHTSDKTAQEFLREKGYQVVDGEETADLFLTMETKFSEVEDKCGFISCISTIKGKFVTEIKEASKELVYEGSENGSNSIVSIGGVPNQYPKLDYTKLYNKSLRKLNAALEDYKGCGE